MPPAKSCFFSKTGVLGRARAKWIFSHRITGSISPGAGCGTVPWLGEGTGTAALPGSLLQHSATRCPCKPRSLLGSAGCRRQQRQS